MSEFTAAYRWWRSPSPRGASFAVKRSEFDAALKLTPVRALREVHLAGRSYGEPDEFFRKVGVPLPPVVADAGFRALAVAVWAGADGRPAPLTADVSFYAVPREERAALSALMRQSGIPLMLRWIRALERAAETRRDTRHRLALYLQGDAIAHAEHSGWPA